MSSSAESILKRYLLSVVLSALLLLSLLPQPAVAQTDIRLDSIARLLAGLPPTHPDHAKLAATTAWKEHSRVLQASWARVRDGQRAALVTWRKTELPTGCPGGQTLFYPFSGADFLNAHWLFPDCPSYVLFGLERLGDVPAVEAMTEKEFAHLLAGVRSFMINLFARNYFVTDTMNRGFKAEQLRGVTPVFMVLMALSGVEVLRVSPLELPRSAEAREPASGRKRELRGFSIDFRAPGAARAQRLDYFAFDATDNAIVAYPEILDRIRALGATTTLIKAASYLLHGREFTRMRAAILDVSRFLVQDDTGLPYPLLRKHGWDVRVYGEYGVPIPPFEYAYQKSLAAAYEQEKPRPLPFRFGYQMNNVESRSNLMIGRLPTAERAPSAAGPGAR